MTTRTRADLVVKILEIVINLPEGQAPEIEDSQRVSNDLPAMLEQLAGEEIVYIGNIEAIPQPLFLPLAKVCAYEMRSKFGVTGEFEVTLKNGYDEGVRSIKVINRGRPTYEPLKTVSF